MRGKRNDGSEGGVEEKEAAVRCVHGGQRRRNDKDGEGVLTIMESEDRAR